MTKWLREWEWLGRGGVSESEFCKDSMPSIRQTLIRGFPSPLQWRWELTQVCSSRSPLFWVLAGTTCKIICRSRVESKTNGSSDGPRAWLGTFSQPSERLFLYSGGTHLVLQKWAAKTEKDRLRAAMLVGAHSTVKAAVSSLSPTLDGTPRTRSLTRCSARPPKVRTRTSFPNNWL